MSVTLRSLTVLSLLSCIFLNGCETQKAPHKISLIGQWILDENNQSMLDPQTSGLVYANGRLYTLADGSAKLEQQQKLHIIDPDSARLLESLPITQFSAPVKHSCFYPYLSAQPDYEAMIMHPTLENHWIWVTEDATRGEPLSEACLSQYAGSGSTEYPSLLVLLEQKKHQLILKGVRPLQFDEKDRVGNFPNDGIEGLALTQDGRLLLGLEKDSSGQARVFELSLSNDLFASDNFVKVKDAGLKLPSFAQGNHPINGMATYYLNQQQGYLLAAARNDDELWIIDLNGQQATKRIALAFLSPASSQACNVPYLMDNSSIEGLAVAGDTLYLINDPWKVNYLKNVQCDDDQANYERFSPLLFSTQIRPQWFE